MSSKIYPVTVTYWLGTTQYNGKAETLRGALRIAARNRNAYGPTFRAADGRELHPVYDVDGVCRGLATEDEPEVCYA